MTLSLRNGPVLAAGPVSGRGSGVVSAVYRVAGTAHDRDHSASWSLILKALCPVEGTSQVRSSLYCKRDLKAHRSGWLREYVERSVP
jgi:hypothetical protein